MKYITFCRGINWDCSVSLKKYNEIYFLFKHVISFLWRVAECLSYIEDAWCLKVKPMYGHMQKLAKIVMFIPILGWACTSTFFICGITVPYSWRFQLNPWGRDLLENVTGSQLFLKFPAFYGTRKLIFAFTRPRHLFISCARSIQFIPLSCYLKIRFNIILPSTLCQINPVYTSTLLLEDPFYYYAPIYVVPDQSSLYPYPTSWRSVLVLSSHPRCSRSIPFIPLPYFLKIHFNIIFPSPLCQLNPFYTLP
jgi:hypothetical protein